MKCATGDDVQLTKQGLVIPFDIADQITLENLKEAKETILKELEAHSNGEWMHEEDFKLNHELLPALDKLIWYFGGPDA